MNLHKYQLYLLEQHSESFQIWSAIIRINTEGKSVITKLGPDTTQSLEILLFSFWKPGDVSLKQVPSSVFTKSSK